MRGIFGPFSTDIGSDLAEAMHECLKKQFLHAMQEEKEKIILGESETKKKTLC
jgi:hypothetical protein